MLFQLNRLYNFTTYNPALFDDAFRRCRVIGIIDYQTALTYTNVEVIQRQIFSSLPSGTSDRLKRYTYILFETNSGRKFVMAYPWIVESSIAEVQQTNLLITVYDADDTDMGRIRDALNVMGYTFKIEQLDL